MSGKGRGTRPRGQRIEVWVTPEERAEIAGRADSVNMSASGYVRAAGLGWEATTAINKNAMADLVRLNDDLNRVGGQLKAWLDDEPERGTIDPAIFMRNLQEIKGEMASVMSRLVD